MHVVGIGEAGQAALALLRARDVDGLVQHVPMHLFLPRHPQRDLHDWRHADAARSLARSAADEIASLTERAPLVVLVAALDEPVGAGAAPVVAAALRREGSTAVVAMCPGSSGPMKPSATLALRCLAERADSIVMSPSTSIADLARSVRLVLGPAESDLIGVDRDEFRVMHSQGGRRGFVAWGRASGHSRGRVAARKAFDALAHVSWRARAIFGRIVGGPDLRLPEVHEAVEALAVLAGDATLICSASIDGSLGDVVNVGVVALGVDDPRGEMP
jgi:cell division GTPase FtsZ